MHPILSRRRQLLLYLAAWAGVAVLLAGLLVLVHPRPLRLALAWIGPVALVHAFTCLSAWWVCRARPLVGGTAVGRTGLVLAAAIQGTAVTVGVAGAWWGVLVGVLGAPLPRAALLADFGLLAVSAFVLYLQSVLIHDVMLTAEASRAAERRALESQVGAREAELRALRAQLNPHFLFNSLNSINALVGADPEGARRMCQSLGDFLRQSLRLGARDAVPLGEELALVDLYLAIERVRFGERLAVERAVTPAAAGCLVPPLLLQPLVENAVKHGVSGRLEGGVVRIEADCRNGQLVLAVENGLDADAPARPGTGLGLENVRRRLEVFTGQGARFEVRREPGRFRVILALPVRAGETVEVP